VDSNRIAATAAGGPRLPATTSDDMEIAAAWASANPPRPAATVAPPSPSMFSSSADPNMMIDTTVASCNADRQSNGLPSGSDAAGELFAG
jgi:hypothetical protein